MSSDTVQSHPLHPQSRLLPMIKVCLLMGVISFHSVSYADITKGDAALAAGDTTQAIAFYQSSEKEIEAKMKLASVWMTRDLDDAEDWIEKARKQDPNHAPMHFLRGQIMGMQASNSIFSALSYAGKSLDSFEKAVALEPTNVAYQQGLLSFYTQAPSIAGGDMDKAKEVASAITALDPIEGLKANIMVYSQLDDEAGLQALIQTGLTQHSDDPWFMFTAGMIKQSQKEYAQAIGMLSQVPKHVPATDTASESTTTEESTKEVSSTHVSTTHVSTTHVSSTQDSTTKDSTTIDSNSQRYYSAQYQIGKTAILAKDFYEQGLTALNNYIEHAQISDGMPSVSWATYRKANIIEAMGDKSTAYQLYQSVQHNDDKQLKKELKKALKRLG